MKRAHTLLKPKSAHKLGENRSSASLSKYRATFNSQLAILSKSRFAPDEQWLIMFANMLKLWFDAEVDLQVDVDKRVKTFLFNYFSEFKE